MKLTIKAVSKFGLKAEETGDKWVNFDRSLKDHPRRGTTIDATLGDTGYILSYNSLEQSVEQKTVASTTREDIARSTAVKAVLNATNLAGDPNIPFLDEQIKKYTKYILTGEL